MSDIYVELIAGMKNLKSEDVQSGVDFFLQNKVKVASLQDLSGFFRISSDTLVHKAQKDLWRITESSTGDVVIERLFDADTKKALKV